MIDNLTGLRFYVAFWVVLYHVREATDLYIITNVINIGYLGVDVFFVLSGYILTHVYYDTFFLRHSSNYEKLRFVQKRFARIFPLHIVTLIGAILFGIILSAFVEGEKNLLWNHILPQIFMVHAWGIVDGIGWNFPSWSISAEWFAYLLIFPFCYHIYRRNGFYGLLIITILIIVGYLEITKLYFNNDLGTQLEFGIIRIIPEFLVGVLAKLWIKNIPSKSASWILLIIYGLLMAFLYFTFGNYQYLIVSSIPLLLIFIQKGNKVVNLIFGNKMIIFLGEISYSIYMVHFFSRAINGIIHRNYFGTEINSPIYFINYIILTMGFAIASYYMIEIPSRKYINTIKIGKR